jgi:hypothetical protein
MTELNFLENREQIRLYLDVGEKFSKELAKGGEKGPFMKLLMQRLRSAFDSQQSVFDKQCRDFKLLHTETNNLLKTTLTLHHTCLQLKASESKYQQLIEEARKGEDMFRERFGAAQDFLDSKKFVDILEKELLNSEDEEEKTVPKSKDQEDRQENLQIRQKIENAL